RIAVEPNRPEPGVTFVVRLPLAPAEETAQRDGAAPRRQPTDKLRILLVEDNDDARAMLRLLLQSQGHEISEAANGADGLAMVLSEEPDVALVDIGLPKLNGLELARRVQAASPRPRSRLIALSGYGMPEDVREALAAGFHSHLVKPVQFNELQRRLDELRLPPE
ncbi:MAG TPA: response regulator, partial [Pirellulales bacterium]